MTTTEVVDPRLDLVLERVVPVSPERIWQAWTDPQQVVKWFTPAPWRTVACEIDLRPGGIFRTVMRSPEGQDFPNVGCWLEIVPYSRLVWTVALGPGFRPLAAPAQAPVFTAALTFTAQGAATRYHVHAMHRDEQGRAAHEAMGFTQGWGAALDQLVACMQP